MTFYVDNPALKKCLHGYETLPISEVPLQWRRLLIFDDTDGLSLRPLPLTLDELIGKLVDKLRLPSNQDSI